MAEQFIFTMYGLNKYYGQKQVLKDINLSFYPGAKIGIVGENGSGKSTLLRILAGLTRPQAGTVNLSGSEDANGLHYLGHLDAVKPAETAAEQARFWARYFGRDVATAKAAMKRVGLGSRGAVPGRGLSAGQKRRLALTRLLIEPRPLWLLDEPTAALDNEGRDLVAQLVAEHRASGGMVIAAVHGDGFAGSRVLDLSKLKANT